MHSGLLAPRYPRTDLSFVCDIGIITRIFDHTAISFMRCIGARMQLKSDQVPRGQTNAGIRQTALVDEGTQGAFVGSCGTGSRSIARAECGMFLHERVPFLAAPVYKRGWQARNAMVLRMSSVTYMHCSSGARRISTEAVPPGLLVQLIYGQLMASGV